LRGSFRLAPLITAIGMSIVLQNFVQVTQGARVKPLPPQIQGGIELMSGSVDGSTINATLSYMQMIIIATRLCCTNRLMVGLPLFPDRLIPRPL
jgi:branched-chain amino acid transport system permease protein